MRLVIPSRRFWGGEPEYVAVGEAQGAPDSDQEL